MKQTGREMGAVLFLAACLSQPHALAGNPAQVQAGQSTPSQTLAAQRLWAMPMPDQPGLPNLRKINDRLYRGAQPEQEGYASLKKLGIKTVINLREFHDDEAEICKANGLRSVSIPCTPLSVGEDEIVLFLKTVNNPENWPVFVHCQHGADRTGVMCAAYRMTNDGWSKDQALLEMTRGNFGFHGIWKNLVRKVRNLDVENLKKAGMIAGAQSGATATSATLTRP